MSKVLVAGVGNVLLGDDGFGCAVVRALAGEPPIDGVTIVDFGIRGFDLACALTSGVEAAIVVDAMGRGGEPGTLYVLDPALPDPRLAGVDAHALDPSAVLALARSLGTLPRVRIVGCEPARIADDAGDPTDALSAPVSAALPQALSIVVSLAHELAEAPHA